MGDTDTSSDTDSGSDHCQASDSDGEVADGIAIVSFERRFDTAEEIKCDLVDDYDRIDVLTYHGDASADHWGEYDCFVGFMASGTAMQKTVGLLDDKWEGPAVAVVDEEPTWVIPLIGGHYGTNQVAHDLSKLRAVPAMTTASEAAGKQGVESKVKTLDSYVANGDSTVTTDLAVPNDEFGSVARLDGPKTVLVGDDVTVLRRNDGDDVILGTGSVSGVRKAQLLAVWEQTLDDADYDWDDVDFTTTGTRKADEPGMLGAAEEISADVVYFEKETLTELEGSTSSRSKELIGWPGIAKTSAIAGGHDHELVAEKRRYDGVVTAVMGR